MSVLLETTLGDLVIDLHVKKTPQTCLNFIKLCKLKYYNFSPVFKLVKDFTLETGDPLGNGTGGECIYHRLDSSKPRLFKADMHPKLLHSKRGTVSMSVIKGEGDMELAGSQFFITLKDNLDYLDGKYAIFGEVAEGFEVLDKLNGIICDEDDRPYQDIRILHTIVLDDPFPDPEGFFEPEKSPEPTKEQLESVRLLPGEELDAEVDPEEAEKIARQREAKVQSLTLEMLGDLPFAEIKPPENVLFVCKLNPITQSSDLELIFSRFGQISSCEIIRDQTTGDSLCYGFVEFDNVKDCEEAYFKMDNVLIDDRRIHVDFSQSVSKLHKNW
ncbi:cyclophilin-like protein, partial [Conidiobolus coronatus NRRL 28638]